MTFSLKSKDKSVFVVLRSDLVALLQLTASGHSRAKEAAAVLATLMDPHESACVASVNNAGHARSSAF